MRYIGLDLGTKTLGIALSDSSCTIATPYETWRFENQDDPELFSKLQQLLNIYQIQKIVLGLPKNMNNTIGPRGEETMAFGKKVESLFKIPVVYQDERLTTVEATNYMLEADLSRKKRKKKIDALAASIILQTYLDKKG